MRMIVITTFAPALAMVAMLVMGGCSGPPAASEGGFDSPNPAAKLYAITDAARQRDRSAIPHLIEQLNSDDIAVRFFAINALEDIVGDRLASLESEHGRRLGYNFTGPAAPRREAIDRWAQAYRSGALTGARARTDAPPAPASEPVVEAGAKSDDAQAAAPESPATQPPPAPEWEAAPRSVEAPAP